MQMFGAEAPPNTGGGLQELAVVPGAVTATAVPPAACCRRRACTVVGQASCGGGGGVTSELDRQVEHVRQLYEVMQLFARDLEDAQRFFPPSQPASKAATPHPPDQRTTRWTLRCRLTLRQRWWCKPARALETARAFRLQRSSLQS